MKTWSAEIVRFSRPPSNIVLAMRDTGTQRGPGPRLDIKELQRRAFERGREVERQEASTRLAALVKQLAESAADLTRRRKLDEERASTFAVELSTLIAERVTRTVLREGGHDVEALVNEVIAAMGTIQAQSGIEVRLAPEDHARVISAIAGDAFEGQGLAFVADRALAPGTLRMIAGDTEFHSSALERIEELRIELREEARHGQAH